MATTYLDSTFAGSAGNLTGYTGAFGETYTSFGGTILLSGSGTIYSSTSSTAVYDTFNVVGTSLDQTLNVTLKRFGGGGTQQIGISFGWVGGSYLAFADLVSNLLTVYYDTGGGLVATSINNASFTLADGDVFSLRVYPPGLQIIQNGSVSFTIAETSVPRPAPSNQAIIRMDGSGDTASTGNHIDRLEAVDNGDPLSAGTPEITIHTTTSVTLSETAAGGSAPYSYQWYKSNTPNFTAGGGNIIGGATASTVTIAVTGTRQYVRCVVTDAVALTATSYQRTIAAARANVLSVFSIGDSTSITPGASACSVFFACEELRTRGGFQNVISDNHAVPGTNTDDWLPGDTLMDAYDASVEACTNRWVAHIELGVNDAQENNPAVDYSTNLTAIVNHVLALQNDNGDGPDKVFVSYPGWREPGVSFGETNYSERLVEYTTVVDGLASSDVTLADIYSQLLFAEYPFTYLALDIGVGYIHPNTNGAVAKGTNIAEAIWSFYYPSSPRNPIIPGFIAV